MTRNAISEGPDRMDAFHALVAGSEELQLELGRLYDPAEFRVRALAIAAAHNVPLPPEALKAELAPDPVGIRRMLAAVPLMPRWPSRHWLPTRVGPLPDGRIGVDWTYFADVSLQDSFFDMSIQHVTGRPFNRIWRHRMTLEDFVLNAPADLLRPPAGFVFHMSRCGSTLVTQMLASVPRFAALSEPSPLDAIVQLKVLLPDLSDVDHSRCLAAMIAALGRPRFAEPAKAVFKVDSWHMLALPLFRQAFPDVPWVYLYRDPVEVMVSQMRQRGVQTVPGVLPPWIYGIDNGEEMPGEDYCALTLARICTAALAHFGQGGGLLVNYDALPEAVISAILPHFRLETNETERALMQEATQRHSKTTYNTFSSDRQDKQQNASPAIRAAVEEHLAGIYDQLEALRLSASA